MKKSSDEERRMQEIREQIGQLDGEALSAFLLNLNLQEGEYVDRIGLSEYQINQIPVKPYTSSLLSIISHHDTCPICLAEFQPGKEVLEMPVCGHMFDPLCASEWLKKSPFCPMCRTNARSSLSNGITRQDYHPPPVEDIL